MSNLSDFKHITRFSQEAATNLFAKQHHKSDLAFRHQVKEQTDNKKEDGDGGK